MTQKSRQQTAVPPPDQAAAENSVVIGRVHAVTPAGVEVVYDGCPDGQAVVALSTVAIEPEHIGRDVALQFARGTGQVIIMGLIYSPLFDAVENWEQPAAETQDSQLSFSVDGNEMHQEITASHSITLRCGEAFIKITRDGKIEINGEELLSQAIGVNRILGGSIELN